MRLGFDIDDTLIDLRRHAFRLYNAQLDQNIPESVFEEIPTVEIHKPFGLTDEEGYEMWKANMRDIYFTDCPAFPSAVEVLNRLNDEGHEIFYITSRPKGFCKESEAWVREKGFPVKGDQFFCGMEDHEKIATIEKLQLDFYIDDKPKVLNTLKELSTTLIIRDQSYNQKESFLRLEHWADFEKIIGEK